MRSRHLLILTALAAVALVVALWMNQQRSPDSADDKDGLLYPALEAHLNEVTAVAVIGADNQPSVTLTRGAADWTVAEKDGYPANRGTLRRTLVKIAQARILEQKTANPELYARLGVEEPGSEDAASTAVRIEGAPEAVELVVGKVAFDGYGTYVRRRGDAGALLVSGELELATDPLEWIERQIVNVAAADLQSVRIEHPDGEVLALAKATREAGEFDVADIPQGRELSSPYAANSIGSALTAIRLDDVRARIDPKAAGAETTRSEFALFDGRIITVESFATDDGRWVNLSVRFDPAQRDRFTAAGAAAAETSGESTDTEPAARADDDVGAGDEPAAPTAEGGAAEEEDPAAAAARLDARLAPWSYAIPDYPFDQRRRRIGDLLAAEAE
jgi:hypothetical protein